MACGRYYKNNFGDGCRGSATVDNGKVYTLDGHGLLTCQDAATGKMQWSRDAVKDFGGDGGHWGYSESPLILGDWVVFKPGGKNCIVALDKASGKEVWLSTGFEAGKEYSSITPFVVGDVPMLATGTSEGLVCVKARTGELAWKNGVYASNTANCPTPAYSDGYVFWANGYGKGGVCMKLDPAGTATETWKSRDMDCHHGGYVIDDGYVYGNNVGGWACLELKTGKKMWNERGIGKGPSAGPTACSTFSAKSAARRRWPRVHRMG